MMQLGRRGVLALGLLLGVGVLLVIGNTIRLEILNRREEIEVVKLVGGTAGFVRRPFLYTGFWYGLLGALAAWILVGFTVWALDPATQRLAGLYGSDFRLSGLAPATGFLLLGTGALLGLLGAVLAVSQHLRRIEPS